MNKQKLFCIIAVALALLSLLPFVVAADQPGRSNFTWLIAKKLTVWYGGAEFNSDLQMNGNEVYLDGDDDTYLSPATDDTIDVYIADAKDFTFSANTFTAQSGSSIVADSFSVTGSISSGTGGITMTDYVMIDGAEDAVQLTVQGYTTQTNSALVVEQSDGTDVFTVSNTGATEINGDITLENDETISNSGDGTIALGGAVTVAGDMTVSNDTTGGNAGAKNQVIGLPRMTVVDLATGTNPGGETVDCMDATPTGEWAEVDAGTNVTVTADTTYYRADTNSVKLEAATVAENDGLDCTIPAQDDLTNMEYVGFWMYSDEAISSGDLDLTVDDSDGTDQVYTIGAVSANVWTWVEVDVSGCDANCDTTDGFFILFTAQGAGALSSPNIYIDELFYWDDADEEALGQAIVDHGVINLLTIPTANATDNTLSVPAEWTDYIVLYRSGNDSIAWITNQSANEAVAMIAY